MGLLALMLLIESRRACPHRRGRRLRAAGRSGSRPLGSPAHRRRPGDRAAMSRRNQPGPYQIQAAINAVHADAPTAAATDWRQILRLYDQLLAHRPESGRRPQPRGRGGRGRRAGGGAPPRGWPRPRIATMFHAIRADLLRRLGRNGEAAVAYEAAIARSENATEREFLQRRYEATRERVNKFIVTRVIHRTKCGDYCQPWSRPTGLSHVKVNSESLIGVRCIKATVTTR